MIFWLALTCAISAFTPPPQGQQRWVFAFESPNKTRDAAFVISLQETFHSRLIIKPTPLHRTLVIDLQPGTLKSVIKDLRALGQLRWVERDYPIPIRLRSQPNDPHYPQLWHLHATDTTPPGSHIHVEEVWSQTMGLKPNLEPIRIALVDDGFDLEHPDLMWGSGYDIADNASLSTSDNNPSYHTGDWHGTQTAGVIAARQNNDIGVTGVCPECLLLPVRLTGQGGPTNLFTTGSAVAASIEWAADTGQADIINHSWGPPDRNPLMPTAPSKLWPEAAHADGATGLPRVIEEAIEFALREGRQGKGTLVIWSAGNGNELVTFDRFASHPGVLAIGSLDASLSRAFYSDYGPPLFLVAPSSGHHTQPQITTTDVQGSQGASPTDYAFNYGGTSASAAMVSGAAGLLLAAFPDLYAAQVAEALLLGATPVDSHYGGYHQGHSPYYGYGQLNVAAAFQIAQAYATECTALFELCGNLRDDDCDGEVDEDPRCTPCVPNATGHEQCDHQDHNCDGSTQEDFVCQNTNRPLCAPCVDTVECAPAFRCRSDSSFSGTYCFAQCDDNTTPCPEGFDCKLGLCLLKPAASPEDPRNCADYLRCAGPEICDGLDNDCNGQIDDLSATHHSNSNPPPSCPQTKDCAQTHAQCQAGKWQCVPISPEQSTPECENESPLQCDGDADDNCPQAQGCAAMPTRHSVLAWMLLLLGLGPSKKRLLSFLCVKRSLVLKDKA
jgi:subtilisin family serine protease